MSNKYNIENIKEDFTAKGWCEAIPVFSENEINKFAQLCRETDEKYSLMKSDYRCKSNVLYPWVDEISRHPKILEIIKPLLGENFHCWDALFWIKYPSDNKKVSFHQDGTYWNFDNKNLALTVWIPFQDVGPAEGPIEYVKNQKSHDLIYHNDVQSNSNLLMRGQTAAMDITETVAVHCKKGSILVHSAFIVHGSRPNISKNTRMALGLIYANTKCKPLIEKAPETTIMISGIDTYNYMEHSPIPGNNFNENLKNWKYAYDQQHINYYSLSQEISHANR